MQDYLNTLYAYAYALFSVQATGHLLRAPVLANEGFYTGHYSRCHLGGFGFVPTTSQSLLMGLVRTVAALTPIAA